MLESSLFYMIPGMDNIQKNYYFQKYEITMKVLTKSAICYHWLIQIITEVFRQLCTMKYAHMNKVFQYIENNKNNEISLSELADEAGISSGYLSRIFKKYYKRMAKTIGLHHPHSHIFTLYFPRKQKPPKDKIHIPFTRTLLLTMN